MSFWAAAIPAAASLLGGLFGGNNYEQVPSTSQSTTNYGPQSSRSTQKTTRDMAFMQAPEFAEAQGARGNWWQTLQDWAGQPGYGAIAPNWEDIWERAKGKVNRYEIE